MQIRPLITLFIASLLSILPASAKLWLPAVFSNNMIIQHDKPLVVWGKDTPGTPIIVSLEGSSVRTIAEEDGSWRTRMILPDIKDPATLTIEGTSTKKIQNVLLGEVWLASGQSNMGWILQNSNGADEALANSKNYNIRIFKTAHTTHTEAQEDAGGSWLSPQLYHSAVAYFFAQRLHQELNRPIGIIESAWGGTPIQAWMPIKTLESLPEAAHILARYNDIPKKNQLIENLEAKQEHLKKVRYYKDPGNRGYLRGWADTTFDDSTWQTMPLPNSWESQGLDLDGAVWFRRTIALPQNYQNKDLTLSLGLLDDCDDTYINGTRIGGIGQDNPDAWKTPRSYKIPSSLTTKETLTIAVRIFDHFSSGGFMGTPENLSIHLQDNPSIPLQGLWNYAIECQLLTDKTTLQEIENRPYNNPANLYNSMIHPFRGYALKGSIWYQGESNAHIPYAYGAFGPAMVQAWRNAWQDPTIGFFLVQLANFTTLQSQASEGGWAWIRETQATVLDLPHTGMATAIDVGEADDIHPKDKTTVGQRLALSALHIMYGKNHLPASSPRSNGIIIKENAIIVDITEVNGQLEQHALHPHSGFALRGEDEKWHWAEVEIQGTQLRITSPQVPAPTAVRYAWAINPQLSIFSNNGLPLLPFRSDNDPLPDANRY